MTDLPVVIAIDGPAGSGKSTVAKAVAQRLGLQYLDTGAMYRSVAFAALRGGVDPEDAEVVGNLARNMELDLEADGAVVVDGVDATIEIRGPEVTRAVSIIAANPGNGQGMTGVLNNSSVNLTGLVPQGGSVTVAAAITHAADTNQADVVNISMNWGSNRIFSTDPALPRPKKLADADPIAPDVAVDAIANVRNTKTLFVVAAGNESVNVFDDD